MAINKGNTSNNQSQQQGAPDTDYTDYSNMGFDPNAVGGNGFNTDADGGFDWTNLRSLYGSDLNVGPSSASLAQVHNLFKDYIEKYINSQVNIELIPVDRDTVPNVAVSALIVTLRPNNKPESNVAWHTLLIESSINSIPDRYETINGRQVPITRLTSDAWDETMMNVCAALVRNRFPNARNILCSDGEVIPRNTVLTDEEQMRHIMSNIIIANRDQLCKADPNFRDLQLDKARKTSQLQQAITFQSGGVEQDQYGNPVRADITLTTTASPINNNNLIAASSVITRCTGYMELLYIDNSDANNMFNFQQQQAQWGGQMFQMPPVYQPEFVITSLIHAEVGTLAGTLQALINVSQLRENNLFLQAFMPTGKDDDIHDIGGIGYDVSIENDGKFGKIKTKPNTFQWQHLMALSQRYFAQGLVIALDVPECGPSTHRYATFAGAAHGNQNCRDEIFKACQVLTGGRFESHYAKAGGNGSFVQSNNNRIMMGYYNRPDKTKGDLRDHDYLAQCNLSGAKDRKEIADYTDSFNSNYSLPERMQIRQILQASYFPGRVLTGYADRIVFEAALIVGLANAAVECGYHVVPQTANNNTSTVRSVASYINGAVLAANQSTIFNSGGTGGAWSGFTGRFG